MRRQVLLLIVLTLVTTGCGSSLGRSIIECSLDLGQPNGTTIISAQAVPTAEFLPCIEALRPGWDFEHVAPESGRVWFALDSDRLGERFVQVTLTENCSVGAAVPQLSNQPGADYYIEVLEDRSTLPLTIVPIAARHREYAYSAAAVLTGRVVDGHRIEATVSDTDAPASDRIARASTTGYPVLIVDDIEVTNGTLSLREPDGDEEAGLVADDVVEELQGTLGDPVYRARWYYVFQDSCIEYDIDAAGPGAERAPRDITQAIGFYDLTDLKDLAREAGYRGFDE